MRTSTLVLLGGLGASLALWWRYRADGVAADDLQYVAVTASKVGQAVASAFTPRGIRNNNPGNIEWIPDPARRWRGMIGQDGRYGIFDTAANGVRAIGGELKASIRKGQSLRDAIYEWAPPSENDTDAYLDDIEGDTGFSRTARLSVGMLPALAQSIIKHETGVQPYNPANIAVWVNS